MAIYTSYYAKAARMQGLKIGISLSLPKDVNVNGQVKWLAPSWDVLKEYKYGAGTMAAKQERYTESFMKQLESIPKAQLDAFVAKLKEQKGNVFLLCYERTGAFCHRHIVAKWLNDMYGLDITEA